MADVQFSAFKETFRSDLLVASSGEFENAKTHGARFVVWANRSFHAAFAGESGSGLTFDECPLFEANQYFEVWLESGQFLRFQAAAGETDGEIRITRVP